MDKAAPTTKATKYTDTREKEGAEAKKKLREKEEKRKRTGRQRKERIPKLLTTNCADWKKRTKLKGEGVGPNRRKKKSCGPSRPRKFKINE